MTHADKYLQTIAAHTIPHPMIIVIMQLVMAHSLCLGTITAFIVIFVVVLSLMSYMLMS